MKDVLLQHIIGGDFEEGESGPGPTPESNERLEEFIEFVLAELAAIATALDEQEELKLSKLDVEPKKPREGLIVFADGVNWNPGSGEGYYGYRSGTWNFLG